MIAIENVLVSDDVIEAKFVCDLKKCKGAAVKMAMQEHRWNKRK